MTEETIDYTFNEIAKIAEKNKCVLLTNATWDAFCRKLWSVAEENKRLKKINEKLRSNLRKK